MRPGAHQPTARGRRWGWGQGDHSTQTSAPQAARQARSLRPNQVYPRGAALPGWQGPGRPPDHAHPTPVHQLAPPSAGKPAGRGTGAGPCPRGTHRTPDAWPTPKAGSPRRLRPHGLSHPPSQSCHVTRDPRHAPAPHEYLPNLGFQDPGGRPQKSHCRLEGPGTPTSTAGNGTSLPALLFGLRLVCDARVVFMTVTQATSAAA